MNVNKNNRSKQRHIISQHTENNHNVTYKFKKILPNEFLLEDQEIISDYKQISKNECVKIINKNPLMFVKNIFPCFFFNLTCF